MGVIKDSKTVLKIALAVASLFSFNNMQQTEFDNYVKSNMQGWVEKRKKENEIEEMIKSKAKIICK